MERVDVGKTELIRAALLRVRAEGASFVRAWALAMAIYFAVAYLLRLGLGSDDTAVGVQSFVGVLLSLAMTAWIGVRWFETVLDPAPGGLSSRGKRARSAVWLWLLLYLFAVLLVVILSIVLILLPVTDGGEEIAFEVMAYVVLYFGAPLVVLRFGLGIAARSLDAPAPGLRGSFRATKPLAGPIFVAALAIACLSFAIEGVTYVVVGQAYPMGLPFWDALIETLTVFASIAPLVVVLGEVAACALLSPVSPPEDPPRP